MNWIGKTFMGFICLFLIASGVYYFMDWNADFKRDCSKCRDQECQDSDSLCGDFGWYHLKLMGIVGGAAIVLSLILMSLGKPEEEIPGPTMKLTQEQKEFLCKWFKDASGRPDYDGYLGQFCIPDEVMDEYKKMYPNDWD